MELDTQAYTQQIHQNPTNCCRESRHSSDVQNATRKWVNLHGCPKVRQCWKSI